MRISSRLLAVTLMGAVIPATITLAEPADKPAAEKHMPSPDTLARIEDGRIAFAKAALKLTSDQEKLWAPVEEKIRANFEARQKMFADWAAKRDEAKAKAGEAKPEKLAMPERMEKRSEGMAKMAEWMTKNAAKTKELAAVLKPLYDSFSEEQKAVASRALDAFIGEDHGPHGRRWAMNRGFGPGHGQWGKGPGPAPEAK
jgi:hypothetical protein